MRGFPPSIDPLPRDVGATTPSAPPTIRANTRVLIIDDHVLLAEALELALSLDGFDARVLALPAGGSMSTVRSMALRRRAGTVILDLDLGGLGDGMSLIAPLVRSGADVIVMTGDTHRGRWGACIDQGARTVLPKVHPLRKTVAVVRALHQGLPVTTAEETEPLLAAWRSEQAATGDQRRRLELLTRREKHVLSCLIEGHDVRKIARRGVVSEATVRSQVKSILAKLGVSSQLAAVGLAHHVGWQPLVVPEAPLERHVSPAPLAHRRTALSA